MKKTNKYIITAGCILSLFLLSGCVFRNQISTQAPTVFESETFEVRTSTVEYGQGLTHDNWDGDNPEAMSLELDVYEPIGAPDNRPVIAIIHGGAFKEGDKSDTQYQALGNYFASRGWVAFSINYRLEGDKGSVPQEWADFAKYDDAVPAGKVNQIHAMYPTVRDSKAAIRWIRANAEEYGINTGYITALGASAGAFTSLAIGTTNEEDFKSELSEEEDPTLTTTNLEQSSEVHSVVSLWGGIGTLEYMDSIYGGGDRFDESDAPILIAHGDQDTVVDFSEAEMLRGRYIETGVYYEFYKLEGATHNAWLQKVGQKNLADLAFDFIIKTQNIEVE